MRTGRRSSRATHCGALIAGLLIPALGAGAETPSDDRRFGQEILEILRDEGTIDDARYEELKAKEEAEWAERQRAGDSAESKSDPKGYGVKYSNGLQFYRNDGFVKLKFGGRIQADFATIHPDASLRAALISGNKIPCEGCVGSLPGDDPQGNGNFTGGKPELGRSRPRPNRAGID